MATALQMADGASTLVGRTATRNDRAAEALGVIEAELLRLSRDGLEPDELERSKGYLIGSSKLRLDTSSAISALLLGLQLDGRPLDWLDTQNARVATVTAEDAQRARRASSATVACWWRLPEIRPGCERAGVSRARKPGGSPLRGSGARFSSWGYSGGTSPDLEGRDMRSIVVLSLGLILGAPFTAEAQPLPGGTTLPAAPGAAPLAKGRDGAASATLLSDPAAAAPGRGASTRRAEAAAADTAVGPDLLAYIFAPVGGIVGPITEGLHVFDAALAPVNAVLLPLTGPQGVASAASSPPSVVPPLVEAEPTGRPPRK